MRRPRRQRSGIPRPRPSPAPRATLWEFDEEFKVGV